MSEVDRCPRGPRLPPPLFLPPFGCLFSLRLVGAAGPELVLAVFFLLPSHLPSRLPFPVQKSRTRHSPTVRCGPSRPWPGRHLAPSPPTDLPARQAPLAWPPPPSVAALGAFSPPSRAAGSPAPERLSAPSQSHPPLFPIRLLGVSANARGLDPDPFFSAALRTASREAIPTSFAPLASAPVPLLPEFLFALREPPFGLLFFASVALLNSFVSFYFKYHTQYPTFIPDYFFRGNRNKGIPFCIGKALWKVGLFNCLWWN